MEKGGSMEKQKVLVIVGPTAVGKTAFSVEIAQKLNGEIISGDSLQIYRDLTIGTAKATLEERRGVPHYLLDEREMTETYSASDFQRKGREMIQTIALKGKCPIVVGGTGLYIQSLLYDFQLGGQEELTKKNEIRQKIQALYQQVGKEGLWRKLQEVDAEAACVIHPNDSKKIMRALEVFALTGKSILAQNVKPPASLFETKIIGLTTERDVLYQRINQRVDQMIAQGILEEAKKLFQMPDVQAAQGIGYKEFFPYFSKEASLEDCIVQVKKNSRRYAKRQLTWFRNRMNVEWWDLVTQKEQQEKVVAEIVHWYGKE